jgi:transposase
MARILGLSPATVSRELTRNSSAVGYASVPAKTLSIARRSAGIEACHGSHFWARELTSLGHTVRLVPTQYVKPFLVGGKNDANDAAAICAAVMHSGIHFVAIKSAEQQSLQSRSSYARTAHPGTDSEIESDPEHVC